MKRNNTTANNRIFELSMLCMSVFLAFSCASNIGMITPVEPHSYEPATVTPAQPDIITVPEYIMGQGNIGTDKMSRFLLDHNPGAEGDFINVLIDHYIREAAIEGINHDVAFAQMCLETGFLKYGGLVTADMNNFCGLGAMNAEQPGLIFENAMIGVRAHIQHLKAYASADPLKQALVDPRYRFVKLGSSPKIEGLAGTWAVDPRYAEKIANILERLYTFSTESL